MGCSNGRPALPIVPVILPGSSIAADWFLMEFTGDLPWVHLDIAGTAWLDEAKAWMAKGPTGVGVRTFIHLAMNW